MKKSIHTLFFVFLVAALASCTTTPKTLKPGDEIGDMTVQNNAHYRLEMIRSISSLCGIYPETEPGSQTTDCNVPKLPWINFDVGWHAEAALLESNWGSMKWEMYFDGNRIDLDSFGWVEIDDPMHGETAKARVWLVTLLDPSPGKHVFRFSWTSPNSIDDGFDVYAPGTYEFVVNLTVVE